MRLCSNKDRDLFPIIAIAITAAICILIALYGMRKKEQRIQELKARGLQPYTVVTTKKRYIEEWHETGWTPSSNQ